MITAFPRSPESYPNHQYIGPDRRQPSINPAEGPDTSNLDAAPYNNPDRLDWRHRVDERFEKGSNKMEAMSEELTKNTVAIANMEATVTEMKLVQDSLVESYQRQEAKQDANNEATYELLEILRMGKGFFRGVAAVGKWARKVILWTLPVATAVLSFWYALTGHVPPK